MVFNAMVRATSHVVTAIRASGSLERTSTLPSADDALEERLLMPWRNPTTWGTALLSFAVPFLEQPGRATYEELAEKTQVFAQMHGESWPNLLRFVNKKVLPFLATEEAAMQLVAHKLAYCHPRKEDCLSFDIKRSVKEQQVKYSKDYRTDSTYSCTESAVIAWRLRPVGVDSRSCTALIVLRGTSPVAGLCAEGTDTFLTGIADDFETGGIGLSGFQKNEDFLRGWVFKLLKVYPSVVITGHSLGGAYAARLLASLPEDAQRKVRLITFNAPAVDAVTAQKIVPKLNNVRLVRHHDDFIHLAGELHPPGWVITQYDMATAPEEPPIAHSLMPMVRASLNEDKQERPQTKLAVRLNANRMPPKVVERGRRFAAFWGAGMFPK